MAFSQIGLSQGIVYVQKNVFLGQSFTESPGQNPSNTFGVVLNLAPKKGTVAISGSNITYTSNGTRGLDTFTVKYSYSVSPLPTQINYKTYVLRLDNSFLTVAQDYAHTVKNQAVTIDVLANDFALTPSGNQSLDLTGVTLANNGTATIVNDKIAFTPSADFTGIAYLNYAACDNFNCASGVVAIVVNDAVLPSVAFSKITTSKNTPVSILLSKSGFSINSNGKKGTATLINGNAFRYVPMTNAIGKDTVAFYNSSANIYSNVEVEIFNKATQNAFAIDDNAYTPVNTAVTVDVLKNDNAQFPVLSGFTQPNPNQGTVALVNGKFNFTPAVNFKGIAKFTYLLKNSTAISTGNPINEWATVYIVVSNFPPAKSVFNLSTPINTPLVLNYQVPITNFNFTVADSTSNGSLTYYPGFTSLNFSGQGVIGGQNLMVYAPTIGFSGQEEFELLYCVNGFCRSVKFVVTVQAVSPTLPSYCVGDCVWAGDANNDGIVDMADILPIGYYQGQTGIARQNASNNWFGQFGNNWNNPFVPSQNLKYIDTNGDGDVTAADTTALSANFLKAHNIVSEKQPNYKATPLFLNVLTPTPQIGDYVEADLLLGKAGVPVTDLHGFTADIAFDPQTINEQSLVCDFYNTSWMTHNSPTLRLSKKPMDGKLYLGYVRTNGSAASGFGKVAKLGFIIEDEINGFRDTDGKYYVTISIKNGKVMGSDGEVYDMPEQTFEIPISTKKKSAFDTNSIFVSPNPTSDVLNINLNNSDGSNEYSIINLNGQTVANGTINKRSAQLNVSNLQTGLYFLRVVTANGVATKKFEVIK